MITSPSRLPKIDLAAVAQRLEILRMALGMEKGDFSTSFGCDPSSYSKIIAGQKPLKSEMAFALSERWGVTMDFLYRGNMDRLPDRFAKAVIEHLTK